MEHLSERDTQRQRNALVHMYCRQIRHRNKQQAWKTCLRRVMYAGPYFPALPLQGLRRPNGRLLQRRQWYLGQSLLLLFFIMPDTPQRSQYDLQLQELVDQFKLDAVGPVEDGRVFVDLDNKERSVYEEMCQVLEGAELARDAVVQARDCQWRLGRKIDKLQTEMSDLQHRLNETRGAHRKWSHRLDRALVSEKYAHSDATTHDSSEEEDLYEK